MILHPGAHFGDSPTPVGVGVGGRIEGAPGATPNREPAVVHRSDCSRASPLARADFASSPPRRWHLHTACFTDEAFVSATPEGLRGTRREAGERWEGSEQRGLRRQDGETRDAKRVLKFRRLHLVHSSTVTARQTVAVIALILEFSLSPFMPLAFSLLLFLSLAFTLIPLFRLPTITFHRRGFRDDWNNFLRKISPCRDIRLSLRSAFHVQSVYVHVYEQIFLHGNNARTFCSFGIQSTSLKL